MPLDYRLVSDFPSQPKMGGTLAAIQDYGAQAEEERQVQRQKQSDQMLQQLLQQHADTPDEIPKELMRRGFANESMAFSKRLAEHRKMLAETAKTEAETRIKALEAKGQSPDQLLRAQEQFAKNANPKTWGALLFAAAQTKDQKIWDDARAGGKVMLGDDPRAQTIFQTIPEVLDDNAVKWVEGLMTADNPQRTSTAAGSDYAQFLARYAAGLNKKPQDLTAEEELKAKQEYNDAGRAAGAGEPFEVFLADQMEGEAAKHGKTPQQLGPAWRAGQAIKARKLWEAANDAPQQAGVRTLSPSSESNILNRLTTQWGTAKKPMEELYRQSELMRVGMEAARQGNMNAGSQAIIATFNKILDPNSVVRESEYDRSAAGQSLKNRVVGTLEKLRSGGANMPLSELENFYKIAQEAVKAQNSGYLQSTRERIGRTADRYGIPREIVFEESDVTTGPPAAPAAPGAGASADGGWVFDPKTGKLVKKGGG